MYAVDGSGGDYENGYRAIYFPVDDAEFSEDESSVGSGEDSRSVREAFKVASLQSGSSVEIEELIEVGHEDIVRAAKGLSSKAPKLDEQAAIRAVEQVRTKALEALDGCDERIKSVAIRTLVDVLGAPAESSALVKATDEGKIEVLVKTQRYLDRGSWKELNFALNVVLPLEDFSAVEVTKEALAVFSAPENVPMSYQAQVNVEKAAELRAIRRMNALGVEHENISRSRVVTYEGEEGVLSPFAANGSLTSCLYGKKAKAQPLSVLQRVRATKQLVKAVAYLHSKRIVHADVKPDNVLMDAGLDAKLADFGTLSFFVGEDGSEAPARLPVGMQDQVYCAPEKGEQQGLEQASYWVGTKLAILKRELFGDEDSDSSLSTDVTGSEEEQGVAATTEKESFEFDEESEAEESVADDDAQWARVSENNYTAMPLEPDLDSSELSNQSSLTEVTQKWESQSRARAVYADAGTLYSVLSCQLGKSRVRQSVFGKKYGAAFNEVARCKPQDPLSEEALQKIAMLEPELNRFLGDLSFMQLLEHSCRQGFDFRQACRAEAYSLGVTAGVILGVGVPQKSKFEAARYIRVHEPLDSTITDKSKKHVRAGHRLVHESPVLPKSAEGLSLLEAKAYDIVTGLVHNVPEQRLDLEEALAKLTALESLAAASET